MLQVLVPKEAGLLFRASTYRAITLLTLPGSVRFLSLPLMSTLTAGPSALSAGPLPHIRKRTSSFSVPRPAKAARMTLRRTESLLALPSMENKAASASQGRAGATQYQRSLQHYKEQRDKRNAGLTRCPSESSLTKSTVSPPPSAVATCPSPAPNRKSSPRARTTSPLAPIRTPLPPRASFPRSKQEPDLYRVAITTRMSYSPEGQKILHMGPRLAMSILQATKELERIVAAQMDVDQDSSGAGAAESVLSTSWVVVSGDDWEMVDCGA